MVCDASTDGDRVCAALRAAGHTVVEAFPRQLLTCVRESRARIVVIDADGEGTFGAFRKLREDPSFGGVDVLLVSEARVRDRHAAMDLGASGLFGRPVDDAQVVRKVNSLTYGEGEALAARASHHATEAVKVGDAQQVGRGGVLPALPAELLRLLSEPIVEDGPLESDESHSDATPSAAIRELRAARIPPVEPLAPGRKFTSNRDARHRLGAAIAGRESGHFIVKAGRHEWSFALREGDVVFVASDAAEHSFFAFLALRGVIARASRAALLEEAPYNGQRAAISAVALGLLQANEVHDYLAEHADWLLTRFLGSSEGAASTESLETSWLAVEPRSVESYATDMVPFSAREGAATWLEAHRRAIEPEHAFEKLRGDFVLARGAHDQHLSLLTPEEHGALVASFEHPLTQIPSEPRSLRAVVIALERIAALRFVPRLIGANVAPTPEPNAVIRARIAARSELVKEGDYFAVLGVGTEASGHEIRRAYLGLRRTLEPARLPHELESLHDEVRTIVSVLDEAYEVLRDNGRRERYRRAITPTLME